MKVKVMVFLAVMVVASIGGISSAQAQSNAVEKANVPFDFYAGGEMLPAGTYTVGVDLEDDLITLSDNSGDRKMFLTGIPAGDGADTSELVFDHSGNTYALKEVKSDVIDLTFHQGARASNGGPSRIVAG